MHCETKNTDSLYCNIHSIAVVENWAHARTSTEREGNVFPSKEEARFWQERMEAVYAEQQYRWKVMILHYFSTPFQQKQQKLWNLITWVWILSVYLIAA